MKQIEIKTIEKLDAEIKTPPSKAHTLRALFIAALANGKSVIKNPLLAEDQKHAIQALKDLGVEINVLDKQVEVTGVNGRFHYSGNYQGRYTAQKGFHPSSCSLRPIFFCSNTGCNELESA